MSVKIVQSYLKTHPMIKGSLVYAVLWPTGCMLQQAIEGKELREFDWVRCVRFGVFGAFYVAPTLYGWLRLSNAMWPKTNFRTGIVKAAIEQISYGPFACISFFMGTSLLEMKTLSEAFAETREKGPPTYKVGICFWPVLQTINFSLVPEHNRVVFVSLCSLIWTVFLAYMKSLQENQTAVEE